MKKRIEINMRKYNRNSIRILFVCFLFNMLFVLNSDAQSNNKASIHLAVAGTTHGHVPLILNRTGKTDITLVWIFEPDSFNYTL